MEIHIDTRRDSPEGLKKVIRFLQMLVNEPVNTSGGEETQVNPDMFSMFDSSSSDDKPSSSSDDEEYKIVPY